MNRRERLAAEIAARTLGIPVFSGCPVCESYRPEPEAPEVEVLLTACEECGGLAVTETGACRLCAGQGLVEVAR